MLPECPTCSRATLLQTCRSHARKEGNPSPNGLPIRKLPGEAVLGGLRRPVGVFQEWDQIGASQGRRIRWHRARTGRSGCVCGKVAEATWLPGHSNSPTSQEISSHDLFGVLEVLCGGEFYVGEQWGDWCENLSEKQ